MTHTFAATPARSRTLPRASRAPHSKNPLTSTFSEKIQITYGHRTGQRRCLPAEPDGPARACLGRDESALRTIVRLDRAHRIRAGPGRRESPPRHPAHRAISGTRLTADRRRRLETLPPRSRPASPVASASAPRSKARAPTPIFVNTAPTSAPIPATCLSWPPSAPTPKPWPVTPRPAAGPVKPNATADSSHASTPTSVRHRPDDPRTAPTTGRRRLRRNHSRRTTSDLR